MAIRIDGTVNNDVLKGSMLDEDIDGGAGDDLLDGDGGADTLLGGAGNDVLLGEDGNDTLDGGTGTDLMLGGAGDDHYEVHDRYAYVYDSEGHDSGTIYVDWYKTDPGVEDWAWAEGVQKLPYWIDALVYPQMPTVALSLTTAQTIHYSFAQTPPSFFDDDDKTGFQAFNSAQIAYTKQVLGYIETLIDVRFVETSDTEGGDTIVFANNRQEDSAGYGAPLGLFDAGSRVMVASSQLAMNPSLDEGAEFLRVVTHEIGHALGLKHPFADPDSLSGSGPGPFLPASDDDLLYTEMSYTGEEQHPGTYSPLDIAALQYIYGPSQADHGTNTRWVMGTTSVLLGDGGGIDLIDGSAQTANLTVFLDDGYWSHIGAKADSITAPGQFSINIGSTIEDALGGSGNDHISGNEAGNKIDGGAGNDVLKGEAGNDQLLGGAGLDTAVYAGARNSYLLAQTGAVTTVTDTTGDEGVDMMAGVERVVFSDGALAFDLAGSAGQAYRLYAAAFDREPDVGGLTHWIHAMDGGLSLLEVATSFTGSDEFTAMYGATRTPEVFLTRMYEHILHRAPDAEGYAYWLDVMDKGVSEGEVLAAFGESGENQAQVTGQIEHGIWYTPGAVV